MGWARPFQSILSAGDGLIDRLLCVVGAVLCSQLPEFIQQYLQRLGGHLDEARRQLDQFREVAAKSGLTLDQLAAKSRENVTTPEQVAWKTKGPSVAVSVALSPHE